MSLSIVFLIPLSTYDLKDSLNSPTKKIAFSVDVPEGILHADE